MTRVACRAVVTHSPQGTQTTPARDACGSGLLPHTTSTQRHPRELGLVAWRARGSGGRTSSSRKRPGGHETAPGRRRGATSTQRHPRELGLVAWRARGPREGARRASQARKTGRTPPTHPKEGTRRRTRRALLTHPRGGGSEAFSAPCVLPITAMSMGPSAAIGSGRRLPDKASRVGCVWPRCERGRGS